jgi:hypothetical protein
MRHRKSLKVGTNEKEGGPVKWQMICTFRLRTVVIDVFMSGQTTDLLCPQY